MGIKSCYSKPFNLIKHIARYLLDLVARSSATRTPSNLIVLVKVDGIGDFVLWLESARALRQHYNGREIVLIANEIFVDLAEKIDFFDQVVEVDLNNFENDWRYRFKVIRKVFRLGAQIAIQPAYSRVFVTGDALVRATGAVERIGFDGDLTIRTPWQRNVGDRWYTRLIPSTEEQLSELERNWEFLKGLGVGKVRYSLAEIPQIAELPDSLNIDGEYFIIFPGAGNIRRMWPADSFGVVARSVAEEYVWQMVVCGTSAEGEIAQRLIGQAGLPDAYNMVGRTSLPEFVELVRGACLLISNETSAIHIAAAVGTPSVCLLGGGHFDRFMPYPEKLEGIKPVAVYEHMDCFGCNWHCIFPFQKGGPVPCVAAIQTQAVLDAVDFAVAERESLC